MGKYFKEDNNQRVSKVLRSVDVALLAEKSIRLAQKPNPFQAIQQLYQRSKPYIDKIPGFFKPFQAAGKALVGTSRIEPLSTNQLPEAGKLESSIGKAIVSRGVEVYGGVPKLNELSRLLEKFIGPSAKYLNFFEAILGAEKIVHPRINQILDKHYLITATAPNGDVRQISPQLKDLLKGRDSNGIIHLRGDLTPQFTDQNITEIVNDMKQLDGIAQEWASFKLKAPLATLATWSGYTTVRHRNSPDSMKSEQKSNEAAKPTSATHDLPPQEAMKKYKEGLRSEKK